MSAKLLQFVDSLPTEDKNIDLQEWISHRDRIEPLDLVATPCDPNLLGTFDIHTCIELGVMPWQRLGSLVVFLAHTDEQRMKTIEKFGGKGDKLLFARAPQSKIESQYAAIGGEHLLDYAHHATSSQYSARSLTLSRPYLVLCAAFVCIASTLYYHPQWIVTGALMISTIFVLGNSTLRLYAAINRWRFLPEHHIPRNVPIHEQPIVSILVPLYRETEVVYQLVSNLMQLDYPHRKLDIILVLEADDVQTIDTLSEITLPSYIRSIQVPADGLRTKPKAMNFCLPFCRGEIIGVYDAEDHPDSMQIQNVVTEFSVNYENTACVQCALEFYNTHQNWFTRCFTIEYRIWFHLVLPALQRLGFPVPLGGTSVFFRADVLRKVGAWDAYNVTEDADLGIRLARMGYATRVISSTTLEEANPNGISWIRQRSRWLKGYAITWASHMRNPISLWRSLGGFGFLGVQIILMGAIINYLAIPLFWLMWPTMFGYDILNFGETSWAVRTVFFTIMVFSQVVSLCVAYMALNKGKYKSLIPWYLTLPFYWPLGAIAAYKAMIELIVAPQYWDKTRHGRGQS